jgi:hypothetical protein
VFISTHFQFGTAIMAGWLPQLEVEMPEFHSGVQYVFNQNLSSTPFDFGTWDSSQPAPTLFLSNSSVGQITFDSGAPVPTEVYANIVADGHSTLAQGMQMSGELGLHVNIGITPHSTLSNDGYLGTEGPELASQIIVGGGAQSTLGNEGEFDPVHGGWSVIDANLVGNGVTDIAKGGSNPGNPGPNFNVLDLNEKVDFPQTIRFGAPLTPDYLWLAKPQFMQGAIQDFGNGGTNEVVAANTTVTNAIFEANHRGAGGWLDLFTGHYQMAQLYFDDPNVHNGNNFDIYQVGGNALIAFNGADHGTLHIPGGHIGTGIA